MKITTLATACLVALTIMATSGFAKEEKLSKTDQTFLKELATGNMGEVHLGAVAASNGSNPAVREFGRWMVSTHSFANRELATIVERMHGEKLPENLDAKTEALMKKLETLKGADFDAAYLHAMEEDHEEDVKKIEAEAKSGGDYLVKTFARNFAPAVKEHLAQVKLLIADMNNGDVASAAKNADMKAPSGGMTGPAHETTDKAKMIRQQHTD